MSFTAQHLTTAVMIGVQSERLDIVDFLEAKYNELSLQTQKAIDTNPVAYDYINTRREEVLSILSWVLDRYDRAAAEKKGGSL